MSVFDTAIVTIAVLAIGLATATIIIIWASRK